MNPKPPDPKMLALLSPFASPPAGVKVICGCEWGSKLPPIPKAAEQARDPAEQRKE